MFDALYTYIENKSSMKLSDDERKLVEESFKPKKLRKRQYFLQEGDVCKYMGFVIKGSSRMFSVDQRGNEHVIRLGLENWWIGDYESYKLLTPARFNIEVLEDTELLLVTNEQMQQLMDRIPAVAAMVKAMDERGAIATQQRMHAAISLTAEERYENLAKTYPMFLQRFPQNVIASYLGISAETLSRIRKNAYQK
ncbi:Crp/Fnr family transcriptional regulator [Mucilaginibacter sp. Bleaf8]|nr:Crp/Fnr family transcriptional regulator [Mucilaginibacter sp. Bleaf8]